MPLMCQHLRDGEQIAYRWGSFHLLSMQDMAAVEHAKKIHKRKPDLDLAQGTQTEEERAEWARTCRLFHSSDLAQQGSITVTEEHSFVDQTDGEVMTFKPGDVLRMWR